jgi:hypothetical protein
MSVLRLPAGPRTAFRWQPVMLWPTASRLWWPEAAARAKAHKTKSDIVNSDFLFFISILLDYTIFITTCIWYKQKTFLPMSTGGKAGATASGMLSRRGRIPVFWL